MRNRTSLLDIALWEIQISWNNRSIQTKSKKHSHRSTPHDRCRQLSPNFPPHNKKRPPKMGAVT